MVKTVLFIDDADRGSIFTSLKRKAQDEGLQLELYQYNPGGAIEYDLIDSETNTLDIDKTIERYKKRFSGIVFDAIACDWNLNVDNVNGLELLRQLCSNNNQLSHTPKMMYSGNLREELRRMITNVSDATSESDRNKELTKLVSNVKLLIQAGFFAFTEREDSSDELISFLIKNDPLKIRLYHLLNNHPTYKFSVACGGDYAEKTFDEVRKLIASNEQQEARLLQDITEAALSFLEHKVASKDDKEKI